MSKPSLLLVHGAASGAWVWDAWRRHLGALGWEVNVMDLRGHGRSMPTDFSLVTMEDYLADLESVAPQIERARGAHPVIGGWGMGALVAMMYGARHVETPGLILLSPDHPLEVAGRSSIEEQRRFPGVVLGPEITGVFPDDFEASSEALAGLSAAEAASVLTQSAGAEESGSAYRQMLRGISIAAGALSCPSLILYGELEPDPGAERARALASHLAGDVLSVGDARRWDILYSDARVAGIAPQVDAWLGRLLD